MDFKTAVKTCFQKYLVIQGRAARSEYWWFTLFIVLASIVLTLVDLAVFGYEMIFSPLSDLFSLATIIPSITVAVRRLHDIDKSGWWLLIALIPIIGWIVLIYWCVQKGTDGDNQYGADPLGGQGGYTNDDDDFAQSSIPKSGG